MRSFTYEIAVWRLWLVISKNDTFVIASEQNFQIRNTIKFSVGCVTQHGRENFENGYLYALAVAVNSVLCIVILLPGRRQLKWCAAFETFLTLCSNLVA